MSVNLTHVIAKGIFLTENKSEEFIKHIESINPTENIMDSFYDYIEGYIPEFYNVKTRNEVNKGLSVIDSDEYIFIGYIDKLAFNEPFEEPFVFENIEVITLAQIVYEINKAFKTNFKQEDVKPVYIPHYH